MFSCFGCAKGKKPFSHKAILEQTLNNLTLTQDKPLKNSIKVNQSVGWMNTPKIEHVNQSFKAHMKQIQQQKTNKYNEYQDKKNNNKQPIVHQIKSSSQFSDCQSGSQDSQTVPYQSKKSASEASTPNRKNKKIKNQEKLNQPQIKRNWKTNNQKVIQTYLLRKTQIHKFHSKQISTQRIVSKKGTSSIDYSKYSQQDKQVSSNKILQLDQEIQSKLNELDKLPFQEAQRNVTLIYNKPSNSLNINSSFKNSRFNAIKRYQNIQNDLKQLQMTQNQIHKTIKKKENALIQAPYKGSLKNVRFNMKQKTDEMTTSTFSYYNQKNQTLQQLIEKTVKTQLDIIQQSNLDCRQFFEVKDMILKQPQNLTHYKKVLDEDEQGFVQNEMMQQTLDQAQNQFHCNSINQQFSRAAITKNYSLALKIFEKMTQNQKNNKDLKGYTPVYLIILIAILDDNAFELTKKLINHSDINLNIKGPTGWSPLQQSIFYKHIRLTPNVFVSTHKKKISLIKKTIKNSSLLLSKMKDFQMKLQVKVDSFIPLLNNLTPNDTITLIKKGNKLLIDYSLVGYEYLSCKRRDMGFLLDADKETIFAINRSKQIYCDLMEELDKQEIQLLVVDSLQTQSKKIDPLIKNISINPAKSIFDNNIIENINQYQAQKYTFAVNYTSMTEKRMPHKIQKLQDNQISSKLNQCSKELTFLQSWQSYLEYQPKVNIKPKNKSKKIELQMWLTEAFNFQLQNLLTIFKLFALCNPLAKIISEFLSEQINIKQLLNEKFPIKIDIPISFSLYFNLQFKGLKFDTNKFSKQKIGIQNQNQSIKKISRKQFQNIKQSKEKRSFALSAFT